MANLNRQIKPKKFGKEKTPHDYPYMVIKPNDDPLKRPMYRTHKEAIEKLRKEVEELQDQFKYLDEDMRQRCTEIIAAIGRLGPDGGSIDMLVSEYSGVRYRVQLVRRQAVVAA
jgi:hypothetical protein